MLFDHEDHRSVRATMIGPPPLEAPPCNVCTSPNHGSGSHLHLEGIYEDHHDAQNCVVRSAQVMGEILPLVVLVVADDAGQFVRLEVSVEGELLEKLMAAHRGNRLVVTTR